jgi:hypothetical protein
MHSSAAVCGRPDENTPDYLRQVSGHAKRVLKRMKEHARCERNALTHKAQPHRQPPTEPTSSQRQRQPEHFAITNNISAVHALNIHQKADSDNSNRETPGGVISGEQESAMGVLTKPQFEFDP